MMITRSDASRSWLSVTLADRLEAAGNRPAGFDYMRLALAAGVIALHSVIVCYGQLAEINFWQSEARPFVRLILPMFFALSGFLVAGSLVRSRTLTAFLALRVIRIMPALSVEAVLSALVLGPIFTSLTLAEYFTNPQFYRYFWNLVGHVQFRLPGVFDANPHPNVVNGQMWTVPYEFYCYLVLALLALIGAARTGIYLVYGAIGVTMAYLAFKLIRDGAIAVITIGPVPGALLIVCFILGVAAYFGRSFLPFDPILCLASTAIAMVLLAVVPYGEYFAPPFVVYLTASLGVLDPPRLWFVRGADYSYGLFLYGFPIQQALVALHPFWQNWTANFIGATLLGLLFAAFSWRFVEKPALRLRSRLQ